MPVKSNNDSIWTDNYIDDNIVVNNIVNDIETQNAGKIIDTKKNLNDSNANKKDDDILNFYMQCKNNCKIGLLNINSLRHKFYPIMQMLQNQYFDILMLQETKLDDSFPNAQFIIDGYVMHRLDHKLNSGGIIANVRCDIPQKKVDLYVIGSLNKGKIELQAIEITVNDEKWLVINMYKEPKTPDATLVDHLDKMLSTYCSQYTNVVLCGDINVNMLKNNSIRDIVDVHGMKNIVTKPTCFKSETPTLIDVVFTTVLKRFKHVCCIESDLSDFHQMVCFSTKFNAPRHINKVITYRSYKIFNREQCLCDLASAPFHGFNRAFNPLSNYYREPLLHNNVIHDTLEHAYQYAKASRYKDSATEDKILCSSTPAEAKQAGLHVRNFDRADWEEAKKGIMLELLRIKFQAGSEMNKFLKNTSGKSLAEAGKSRSFAIGMPLNSKNIFDTSKWPKNCNMLVKCLMEVRTELNA